MSTIKIPANHASVQLVAKMYSFIELGERAFANQQLEIYHGYIEQGSALLREILSLGHIHLAIALEFEWYNRLVKKIESESHYAKCFALHQQDFWHVGQAYSPGPPQPGNPDTIAFVAPNDNLLGHTQVMLSILKQWRKRHPEIEIWVIFLSASGDTRLIDQLIASRVSYSVPDSNLLLDDKVTWVRESIIQADIGYAVWLSLPTIVSYLFGYRVCARQVLWSLKFHPVHLGEAICHIGMTQQKTGTVRIHDREWLAYRPPLVTPITPLTAERRHQAKQRWQGRWVFGTLAREEKFHSPAFISTVIRILHACPDSVYLYTGRKPPPPLAAALSEAGLTERAFFLGWIDTDYYAGILDTFLETFPFGCAITGMQALMHGTPMISLWHDNTLPTYYFDQRETAARFTPNWLICADEVEYIDRACQLYRQWHRKSPGLWQQAKQWLTGAHILEQPYRQVGPELQDLDADSSERLLNLIRGYW